MGQGEKFIKKFENDEEFRKFVSENYKKVISGKLGYEEYLDIINSRLGGLIMAPWPVLINNQKKKDPVFAEQCSIVEKQLKSEKITEKEYSEKLYKYLDDSIKRVNPK
jgi:hypothetical protein